MASVWFTPYTERSARRSAGPGPIKRTDSPAAKALTSVTPPWLKSMKGAKGPRRQGAVPTIPKARTIKRSTFEDF